MRLEIRHAIRTTVGVSLLLAMLMSGCGLPAAAPLKRAEIIVALRAYEVGKPRWAHLDKAKVGVRDRKAEVRYAVQPSGAKSTLLPIKVTLVRRDDAWQVVSEKRDQPWWRRLFRRLKWPRRAAKSPTPA